MTRYELSDVVGTLGSNLDLNSIDWKTYSPTPGTCEMTCWTIPGRPECDNHLGCAWHVTENKCLSYAPNQCPLSKAELPPGFPMPNVDCNVPGKPPCIQSIYNFAMSSAQNQDHFSAAVNTPNDDDWSKFVPTPGTCEMTCISEGHDMDACDVIPGCAWHHKGNLCLSLVGPQQCPKDVNSIPAHVLNTLKPGVTCNAAYKPDCDDAIDALLNGPPALGAARLTNSSTGTYFGALFVAAGAVAGFVAHRTRSRHTQREQEALLGGSKYGSRTVSV